jgi:hypothetical protein
LYCSQNGDRNIGVGRKRVLGRSRRKWYDNWAEPLHSLTKPTIVEEKE